MSAQLPLVEPESIDEGDTAIKVRFMHFLSASALETLWALQTQAGCTTRAASAFAHCCIHTGTKHMCTSGRQRYEWR